MKLSGVFFQYSDILLILLILLTELWTLIKLNSLATELIFLTTVSASKMQLFIQNTTPYIHLRLDSRIGPRVFEPRFSD